MKGLIIVLIVMMILYFLTGCSTYPVQHEIQGEWFQELSGSTDEYVVRFTDSWLFTYTDKGLYSEDEERYTVQYWDNLVYIDGVNYEYKIYGEFLQIDGEEFTRREGVENDLYIRSLIKTKK